VRNVTIHPSRPVYQPGADPRVVAWGRARLSAEGAKVEVPRGWSVWRSTSSPLGKGSGEGTVPPPQKILDFFYLKMAHFRKFWRTKFRFLLLIASKTHASVAL